MSIHLQPMIASDRAAVVEIYNYYIENSFAAYPEEPVDETFFDFLRRAVGDYPTVTAKDDEGILLGWATLRPYSWFPTLAHTAEITYFIAADATGQKIGSRFLEYLGTKARKRNITCIIASISSKNPGSINFHRKHGFEQCGCFRSIGKKKGDYFDVIWMQKMI